MTSNLIAMVAALPGWNLSLLMLLAKATIILIAALGITRAMPRASAGARHLVWLVTLGTLLFVPVLAAWAPLRLAILPAATPDASVGVVGKEQGRSGQVGPSGVDAAPGVSLDSREAPPAAAPSTPPHATGVIGRVRESIEGMSGITIVLALWAAVVLAIMASLAWAGLAVRRIVRHSAPLDSADWVNPLFEIADRLGLEEAPRLLRSDAAKMPFACGVLSPTIILPAEADAWTLDRRRAVLLHELAHVRRHDLLGHTLGRLACAVYWFHPLVWTAAKRLRNESERACDDLALSCGTRATDYAEHLLDIVTSVRGDSTPLVALAMARRKEFEGRMLAILDPDLRHSMPSRKQSAALIGTLSLISLTVAAAAPVPRAAAKEADQHVATRASMDSVEAPVVPPVTMRVTKAYPDSGVRGANLVTAFSQSGSTRTAMYTSKHTSESEEWTGAGAGAAAASASAEAYSRVSPRPSPAPVASPAPLASVRPISVHTNSDIAIQAIANAGVKLGIGVASSVLDGLGQAVVELAGKGDKGTKGSKNDDRPVLLAKVLASDTSASLRRIAAWGLQEYADSPVAADALASAVRRDSDANVREMAAWALGNGGDRSSAADAALSAALKNDASDKVRATSAWALGNMGDRSATDALTGALADANTDVRMRAAWALGNVEPRQAPRALVTLLGDKDPRTRELAAWALHQIEDPSSAPALEAALKTEQNKDVQLAFIRAIASMGEKSVDALRGLLESSDPKVRTMAVRALAGGNAAGPWPWPWPMPRPFP